MIAKLHLKKEGEGKGGIGGAPRAFDSRSDQLFSPHRDNVRLVTCAALEVAVVRRFRSSSVTQQAPQRNSEGENSNRSNGRKIRKVMFRGSPAQL